MKRARAGRHHPRGMTLLIALAVISVVTAATLVSLRVVSQESELQGRERHSREAFFAAEAGLAEGRQLLAALATDTSSLVKSTEKLSLVNDPSFPRNLVGWRVLMPSTGYTLAAGSRKALDPTVATAKLELRDINNKPFVSFPEQDNVTYRVFVHDDDSAPDNATDNTLWVVAMGEVTRKDGVVLARSVVRALVTSTNGSIDNDGTFQKGGGATKVALPAKTPTAGMGESFTTSI